MKGMAAKKRVSDYAKEWGVDTKEIVTKFEKLGMRGRKAQSAVTEEEAERVHEELGLATKPTISVGGERVVEGAGQTMVERRVGTNVIRRRTTKREEEAAPPPPPPITDDLDLPGSLEVQGHYVPPSLSDLPGDAAAHTPAPVPPPPPIEPVSEAQ